MRDEYIPLGLRGYVFRILKLVILTHKNNFFIIFLCIGRFIIISLNIFIISLNSGHFIISKGHYVLNLPRPKGHTLCSSSPKGHNIHFLQRDIIVIIYQRKLCSLISLYRGRLFFKANCGFSRSYYVYRINIFTVACCMRV